MFGIPVDSSIELPLLKQVDSEPEVTITSEDVSLPSGSSTSEGISVNEKGQSVFVSSPEGNTFQIKNGAEIIVDSNDNPSEQQIQFLLLGPIMGFLLYQRGLLPLHGSSVKHEDESLVFLGKKGAGKSTTASAFVQQDATVLADDITAIDTADEEMTVLPSHPHVKLEENHFDYDSFPSTKSLQMKKQYYRTPSPDDMQSCPLSALFVLDCKQSPEIEPLSSSEAIWELLNNVYLFQFTDQLTKDIFFEQIARVVDQTPVYRLARSNDITQLPELVDQVKNVIS